MVEFQAPLRDAFSFLAVLSLLCRTAVAIWDEGRSASPSRDGRRRPSPHEQTAEGGRLHMGCGHHITGRLVTLVTLVT